MLHRVKCGLSRGLLVEARAGTAAFLFVDSGSRNWHMMRQGAGEPRKEWFGTKSISFSKLEGTVTPVIEHQQQHAFLQKGMLIGAFKPSAAQFYYS